MDPAGPYLHLGVVFLSTQLCAFGGVAGEAAWKQAPLAIPLPGAGSRLRTAASPAPRHPGCRAFSMVAFSMLGPTIEFISPSRPRPLALASHITIRLAVRRHITRQALPEDAKPEPLVVAPLRRLTCGIGVVGRNRAGTRMARFMTKRSKEGAMLVGLYRTKRELAQSIGEPLHFEDRSLMASEYAPFGTFIVVGPGGGALRSWMAEVTLLQGRIVRVD
jgi:hypothetical protein